MNRDRAGAQRGILILLLLTIFLTTSSSGRAASRIKDLVSIEGVRENQLIGYGLVVGLNGTGDRRQTLFSTQSLANLLQRMGVSVPAAAIRVQNTAAVIVTAALPPFARPGSRIDVTVASMGDSTSLQGGLLLLTSLRGADGTVYSVAQGALALGGYSVGRLGTSKTVNHPTTARIPNGAIVEQAAPAVVFNSELNLQLHQADFTTSARIAQAINAQFPGQSAIAKPESSGLVRVQLPSAYAARPVEFLAELEKLPVEPDRRAKVAINERTGTIVMGGEVQIAPVTVMHGNLTVEIQTAFDVSQPEPFSQGQTQVVQQSQVQVNEEKARSLILQPGATVEDLVRSLAAIGATSRDIISILQNLKVAGALDAEVEVL